MTQERLYEVYSTWKRDHEVWENQCTRDAEEFYNRAKILLDRLNDVLSPKWTTTADHIDCSIGVWGGGTVALCDWDELIEQLTSIYEEKPRIVSAEGRTLEPDFLFYTKEAYFAISPSQNLPRLKVKVRKLDNCEFVTEEKTVQVVKEVRCNA